MAHMDGEDTKEGTPLMVEDDSTNRDTLSQWLDTYTAHRNKVTTWLTSTKNAGRTGLITSARRFAYALVPQLLRYIVWGEDAQLPALGPTTWMDGLRGWAAVVVFNYHFFFAFTDGALVGYGADKDHHAILELPYLSLSYNAASSVCIFFAVAGYVGSIKSLHLMTNQQSDKVLVGLCGSVFRKWFRLYLPTLIITFMTLTAVCIGLYEPLRPMFNDRDTYFAKYFTEQHVRLLPSFWEYLKFWLSELRGMTDMFRGSAYYIEFDPHLWSIQCEVQLMMHLFLILIALARCRPWMRIFCLFIFSGIYLTWNRWTAPLFFLGAALAQYDVIRAKRHSILPEPAAICDRSSNINSLGVAAHTRAKRMLRFWGYVGALFLMSTPMQNFNHPALGFGVVNSLTPEWLPRKDRFPKTIGTLFLLYLLTTSPHHIASSNPGVWHRFLTHPISRYFGKHMFSIYLVHGPILHLIGYGIPLTIWTIVPRSSSIGFYFGTTIGWTITFVLVICAADVFTREIDARCAKIIRWLENTCLVWR